MVTKRNQIERMKIQWKLIIMTKLPGNTILQMQVYELKMRSKCF